MPIRRAGSKQLKEIKQLKSKRGSFVLSALLALTLLWTYFSVQNVIARHKPLPSQLRAQTQAKQLSDHLAASELHSPTPSNTMCMHWHAIFASATLHHMAVNASWLATRSPCLSSLCLQWTFTLGITGKTQMVT